MADNKFIKQSGIFLIYGAMVAVFAIIKPQYISIVNIRSVIIQTSLLGIIATGMTLVMMTGGVDLSVGAVAGVSTLAGLWPVVFDGKPLGYGILIAVSLSLVFGVINGICVSHLGVAPFVATLGTMFLAEGLQYLFSEGGMSISYGFPKAGIVGVGATGIDEYSTCNLTSDNFNGGEQLGLYVANKLGGQGNILLLDTPGWHSLEIRIRMLESVIMDYPNLNVVQTISIGTQDAVNNYYKEVKAYLLGNSNIDCIYCSWGLAAVGAAQAVRELQMQDKIFIVCTDADQVVLEEMKKADSPLTAVVGQYPEKLGSGAVEMAVSSVGGTKVPREVYAPIILIEKQDPNAWFSSPAIMTIDEAWNALYSSAN